MVQDQGCRRVGLIRDVFEEYQRLDSKWTGRLKRHFENFGRPGTTMPREHFNSEGRYPTGGKQSREVMIYAFKAFQCRIYGPMVPIKGFPTFVGFEFDMKKTDRADQALLRRVARRFGQFGQD